MKRFIAALLASVSYSAIALAQSQDFPSPVLQTSPTSAGAGQVLVLPFTNGGEASGQFNASSAELIEGFDTSTLNTLNNWRAPTTGGSGNAVAATNAAADTVLSGGLTAGGWSLLQSIKVFTEDNPGYLFLQTNVNITPALGATSGVTTGNCMFIGFGTMAANPVCGAMAVNAAGFETTTAGVMNAVTYASSGRLLVSDLSVIRGAQATITQYAGGATSGQPIAFAFGCRCVPQLAFNGNTGSHKLGMYMRGDNIVYAIEGINGILTPVAETVAGSAGLDVNAVPLSFAVVAAAGATTAGLLQINQATVARTSAKPPSLTPVTTGATGGTSLVLKSYPGQLVSAYAGNPSATAGMLAILNLTAAPSSGVAITPIDCVPLAANGTALINNRPGPFKHYNVGLTAVISNSCSTFTAGGPTTAFISGDVQ